MQKNLQKSSEKIGAIGAKEVPFKLKVSATIRKFFLGKLQQ